MARRRNKLDYFAFFPKDCEADESIRLMDDAQFGFWMRCLCYQWPNGSIPADAGVLAVALSGRAAGGEVRTPKYIEEMLSGPVGNRMKPHPLLDGRLADTRLLTERAIAEEESATNKKNRSTKDEEFVEGKTENSCDDSLFCSVSVLKKKDEVEQWFETEFWPMYPRKVAKPKALRAARKHGETVEARARIMETLRRALPALRQQLKADEDYRPYPASWLNQEPWLNEASPTQSSPAPAPWKADW